MTSTNRAGWLRQLAWLTALFGAMLVARLEAAPQAGSQIGNQATATYTDESGVEHTVTSNIVYVTVQQVAAVDLTTDNTRPGAPGSQVAFPHTVTNTGNGPDIFDLVVDQLTSDNFDLNNVAIYADADGDGVPDNQTPITSTPNLQPGESFNFVVVGTVPVTATDGQSAQLEVTATSRFDPTESATNTDTVNASTNAVIAATKSIDQVSGPSPSGPYLFTLSYVNHGVRDAIDVTLSDLVPAGFTYVPGSGRWSGSGATALTDAAGSDPTGIAYDYNVTAVGTLTAVIASVAQGANGTVTFQVMVDSGLPAGNLSNTAEVSYDDGTGTEVTTRTNTTVFEVTNTPGSTFTGETIPNAPQTSTVVFHNELVNTGNAEDTFDVTVDTAGSTFPAGTSFVLYRSDATTLLLDTNGNGVPDTGPVAAGASYTVVLKAILPRNASGGGPYTVDKTARSTNDPSQTTTTTDELTTIDPSTVDLTNNVSVATATLADGLGTGPETAPVTTVAVDPGQTASFTLFVNNTSAVPDTYNLAASSDATFASIAMADGLTVRFRNLGGTVITNTGLIQPGASLQVTAEVTVPAGLAAGLYDVYYRALSPTSESADIKHDAVSVNAVRALSVETDNIGQVSPGGTVVYTHTVTNQGNVVEGDGSASTTALNLTNTNPDFNSVIYWDRNNNGVLDADDIIVQNLDSLVGGTNGASTAPGLDPGESATLFVVVYATPGAAIGSTDVATLSTETTQGAYPTPPGDDSASDTTTVISGNVVLTKRQALDADGDGTPETPFSQTNLGPGAIPGACIRYELTVTNNGTAPALNVVVTDGVPTFTTYHAGDGSASPTGTAVWSVVGSGTYTACTAPGVGLAGNIIANIGTLQPNQSVKVTFGVKIQD